MIEPREAWFVVAPGGEILPETGDNRRDMSIARFCKGFLISPNWAERERQGWSCVKLLISEPGGAK